MPSPPRRRKRGRTGQFSHRPVRRFPPVGSSNWREFQAALHRMVVERNEIIVEAHRRLGGRLPASHQDKVEAVTAAAAAHGYDQPVWGWGEPGQDLEDLTYAFFAAYFERYGSQHIDDL